MRHEIHIRSARRDFRCVKVQAVRHRRLVYEREVHGVTLGDSEHWAGHAAVERPGIVGHAIGDGDLRVLDRDAQAMYAAGRARWSSRIDGCRRSGRADRRFTVRHIGGRVRGRRLDALRWLLLAAAEAHRGRDKACDS